MVRRPRRLLAWLVLAGLSHGCASAYRQGRSEAEKGNWDMAVARFTKALQGDPNNIRYKLALENARIAASRFHYAEAKKHLAANDLDAAADSLEVAVRYDPANRSATDDLAIARDRIRKREEERRQRDEFDMMKSRAGAVKLPIVVLSPRSTLPVTIKFTDASLEKILESLGKLAAVNVLFDEGFRDKKYTVNISGVSFQEALDQITFVNRLFYKVLDQNTIIIVPESRQKRAAYDELLLKTFYVQNAELNDVNNIVKQVGKIPTTGINQALGAITVVGTPDQLALAERIINANDKARGEVMIEVQILNVDRTKVKDYGLALSQYGAGIRFNPTGNASDNEPAGFASIRAHMLSSFNLADFVVRIPNDLFAKFIQNESNSRILASPRLRAAEGKKATLKVGQEVPVPVTTFSSVTTGGGNQFAPATSFQYRNVGVNLDITPRVSASGDITLELTAEFSLLGGSVSIGNSGDLPTFLTRNVTGTLRVRDGETSLIGGLLQQSETDTLSGVLGLQSVPILNKVFTNRTQKKGPDTEILISITPHIVRAPKLTEADLIPLGVGTQEVPKVEGARPALFGPELPAPSPSPTPTPTPPPPARPGGPGLPGGAVPPPIGARTSPPPTTPPVIAPPTPGAVVPGRPLPEGVLPGGVTPTTPPTTQPPPLSEGAVPPGGAAPGVVLPEGLPWDPLESTCRHASLSIL